VNTNDSWSGVPLLSNLTKDELNDLQPFLTKRLFREGDIIFHQDDPGDRLFLIRDGRVKISLLAEDGRENVIAIMAKGDCFGELAALDGLPRSATATAMERTETLFLRRGDLLQFLERHPGAAIKVIDLLSRRLRQTDEQIADLAFLDVHGRVARKLLELASAHGVDKGQGTEIGFFLSQQELANLVGASRESVNKVINYFKDKGYLAINRGRIVLMNRRALEQRASY